MAQAAVVLVLATCAAGVYLAPSIIAYARAVPGIGSIVTQNLLAGWTVAGWVAALRRAMRPAAELATEPPRQRRAPAPCWRSALAAGRLPEPGRAGTPPPLRLPSQPRLGLVPSPPQESTRADGTDGERDGGGGAQ